MNTTNHAAQSTTLRVLQPHEVTAVSGGQISYSGATCTATYSGYTDARGATGYLGAYAVCKSN
ncbi:MAG: hypothetical protein R3E33_08380 [Rhodocyclaceae bacterium]